MSSSLGDVLTSSLNTITNISYAFADVLAYASFMCVSEGEGVWMEWQLPVTPVTVSPRPRPRAPTTPPCIEVSLGMDKRVWNEESS